MKKIGLVALICLVALLGTVGQRYYAWVTNSANAADPFDEVGIGLHSYMPGFVQDWGCARLKENFGSKTLPPHGCGTAEGQWK